MLEQDRKSVNCCQFDILTATLKELVKEKRNVTTVMKRLFLPEITHKTFREFNL